MFPRHRFVWVALLGFGSSLGAVAQAPHALSERLGPEIDAAERSYFGLFPEVRGFDGARTETAPEGAVRVVIARAAQPDSVLVLQRVTAEALGRFVETFEQHETAFYNPSWQLVSSYVRPEVTTPYVGRYERVTVEVAGGRYVGHPYYVSDSLVILTPGNAGFDWRTAGTPRRDLVLVRAEAVEGIRKGSGWLEEPWVPALGAPIGFGVDYYLGSLEPNDERGFGRSIAAMGAGVLVARLGVLLLTRSRSYEQSLAGLEQSAWFSPERRPPDLPPPTALVAGDGEASIQAPPRWNSLAWLGLGVTVGLGGEQEQTYGFFTNFEPADSLAATQVLGEERAMTASALLRPQPWLSLGVNLYASALPDLGDLDLQEVAASRQSFRAFGAIDPVRLVWPRSPVGVSLGGGVVRSEAVAAQRFPENAFTTYDPDGYELRETGFRPYLMTTAEVVLPLDVALYGGVEWWSAPDVDVPLTEVQSVRFPGTVVYRVDPHTVAFSRVGVVGGLRVGL